jgi:5-enolpyruvylshikimate-3-phosphate synthase
MAVDLRKEADLFLGNAGTAFRPLTAALSFCSRRFQARQALRACMNDQLVI